MLEARNDDDPVAYPGDLGVGTGYGDEIDDLVGEDSSGEVSALDAEIQSAQSDAESYTGADADSSKASSAAAAKRVANQKTLSMLMQKRAKAAGMFAEGQDTYLHNLVNKKMKISRRKLQQIIKEELGLTISESKEKRKRKKGEPKDQYLYGTDVANSEDEVARHDAWAGGDNLNKPAEWQKVLDMINEETASLEEAEFSEDVYGEIPPGMQMMYSKPEALDAVSGIADQTDCPITRDALMQVIHSLRDAGSGCG